MTLQPSIRNTSVHPLSLSAFDLASHPLQALAQLPNIPPPPLQALHPIRCDHHKDRGSEPLPDR